jgi:proteasome activator subunit 3 (PA28 gamma)
VYPPPTSEEQPSKKRKLNGSEDSTPAPDAQFARYPNLVLSNAHVIKLAETLKMETEQLDINVVGNRSPETNILAKNASG